MKKLTLLACAALVAASTLSSCKKDYTCTQTVLGTTVTVPVNDATKKDIKEYEDAGYTCTVQ